MQKAPYTVRDATRDLLRDLRMTTIFGNPGSTDSWSPVGTSLLTMLHLGLTHLLALVETSTRAAPAPRVRPPVPEAREPISAGFAMHTVAQIMPPDAVIVEETPSHRTELHDYLPIRRSNGFYTGASGGLGYALPAAVGIALADPTRRVICLVGDGASMYSIQGLWNAAQYRLPITFVVFNNQGYAALKSFGRMFDVDAPPGVDLPNIDIETIARGYGCEAMRIARAEELAPALTRSFESSGPVVLNVLVDPTIRTLF